MSLAWGGYRNGQIPLSAMYVERGERFEPTAGHYLDELERAFAKVWGYPAIILEGYRSLARQRALYAGWRAGTGDLAALPGTSNHGWGRAADFASHINVYGTPQKDWMNAHAPAYGWHPAGDDFRPREAWHFEYWSGTATASLTASPIEGFLMALTDKQQLQLLSNVANIYAGVFQGAEVKIGGKVQKFNYGVLPIVAHSQTLIAGLSSALQAMASSQGLDPAALQAAVEAAAQKGAAEALKSLTITVS